MQYEKIMAEQSQFFETLAKKQGAYLREAPWTTAQINPGNVNLLSRKKLAENLLERILPLYEVSEDLNRFAGLQPLYEGINMLDPHYCRMDEAQRMLDKCLGLNDHQRLQLAGAVMHFMDIVKQTNLNTLQLKTTEILTLWWKIFPQNKAWNALKWLWDVGVAVPHSQSGFRAWQRFTRGNLADSVNISETHPKKWLEICEEQTDFATAFEADRMAAAFSGDGRHAGLVGVCAELPDCENCELSSECLWCKADKNSVKFKIEEKIQRNLITAEDIPELMGWLLTSNPEEGKALEDALNLDTPLKDWSRKRLRSLGKKQPLGSKLNLRVEALRELCRNYGIEKLKPQDQFSSSRDIFKHFHQQLSRQKQEQFIIVLLDNKHRYLAEEDVSKGILNKSLVHPREVFASAIEHRAAAMICIHNHPSGDPEPSQEDLRITERLVEVGKLVGIPVLDHVIIGHESYTSFADKGIL
jgi:DNA repair protein RadC